MGVLQFLHAIFHLDQYIGSLMAQYGTTFYLLLFAVIFCETAFVPLFFLPGDPLLFVCGTFSAGGAMNVWTLALTLFAATAVGCTVNYWIGRGIGKRVFTHDYRWLDRAALMRTHVFYEKKGGALLIFSPYIAVVRTFAPFIAGISEMQFSRFQLFNLLGAALWVVGLVFGGNLFGNIPFIHDHLNLLVLTGAGIGIGALFLGTGWRLYRSWVNR